MTGQHLPRAHWVGDERCFHRGRDLQDNLSLDDMSIRVDGDSGNITTPGQHHHTFNPAGSRIQVLAWMGGNVILISIYGEMSRLRGDTRLVDNRFMMSNRSDPEVQLSIVIPVYNEEACVSGTLAELVDVLNLSLIHI